MHVLGEAFSSDHLQQEGYSSGPDSFRFEEMCEYASDVDFYLIDPNSFE